MAKRIELSEASNFIFESSSDDDTCSESLYSPDSEDCSETSSSGNEDTSSENDDDAAPNSIIWHQPAASFMPKFPTHDYIPCKSTVELLSILHEIDSSKFSFQKVCVYSLHSVQTKQSTCITSKKYYDSPYRRRWSDDSFKGHVCNVL